MLTEEKTTTGRDKAQIVNGVLTILRLEQKERYATPSSLLSFTKKLM